MQDVKSRYREALEKKIIKMAREDINVFARYVMRDEKGNRFQQAGIHIAWHAFIDFCELHGRRPIILAPWGSGKCLAENTMVQTFQGSKKIKDITQEDAVLAWRSNGQNHLGAWRSPKFSYARTSGAIYNGIKECIRVHLDSGRQLLVSRDHRIPTQRGDVFANNLIPGVDWCISSFEYQIGSLSKHISWEIVTAIEDAGKHKVYDLSVPGYGYFSAESIVVHNSQQIAIARILWELGKDPSLRIKIIANSDNNAKARVAAIGRYITESTEYQKVFPEVKPDRAGSWSAHQLFVEREGKSVDPSLEAKGIMATGIGGRADLLLFDDVVDQRNAIEQPALRPKIKSNFKNVWMSRLDKGGRIWYIATAWHYDDLTSFLRYNTAMRNRYWIMEQAVTDDLEQLRVVLNVSDGFEDDCLQYMLDAIEEDYLGKGQFVSQALE